MERQLAVSVPEAAQMLGISERHAWNLVQAGRLRTVRLGRRIVVSRRELDKVLAGEGG